MKSLLTLLFFLATQAFAFDGPASNVLPLEERFKVFALEEKLASGTAQKLIGHLTLAVQSIDFQLKTSAMDHITTAKVEANFLVKESKVDSSELKLPFGKFTYGIGKLDKDYYVPVWFGEGINEEISDYSKGKRTKVEIKKSTIVTTTVKLNMKTVLEQLDAAQTALASDDYEKARGSLELIFSDVLSSEKLVDDPILTVWSNLVLAREFMNNGEFKSARFTLKKAVAGLKDLEKKKILKKDEAEAQELRQELDGMTRDLNEKAPGPLLRAKNKIKSWVAKVKSWV